MENEMDSSDPTHIIEMDTTVANKIRALDVAGFSRPDIARLLNKRPQHVRNVLEDDKRYGRRSRYPMGEAGVRQGVAEPARAYKPAAQGRAREVEDRGGGAYRLVVREDGSVLLPEAVRAAFGVGPGEAVMARLTGDEFKLISTATALKRIDELVRPFLWQGGPMASDQLIAERRAEAARDSDG